MGFVSKVGNDIKNNPLNYAFPVFGAANAGIGGAQGVAQKAGMNPTLGGSGGKGSGAPQPPDFNAAAQAQGAASAGAINAQTQANRPDQYGPFGSSQWSQGPNGQWSQNTSLNGQLGGAANGLEGQIAQQAGTPMMTGEDARNQAISGAYNQATSRLDPQWAQRDEQNKAQLAAQGFDTGSEGYNNEMGNFNRARNDAYSSAMNGAIGQGTAAQQATFNENMAQREMPYQELQGLQGLTGQPGFTAAGAAQPSQFFPAAAALYQGALQNYGIQQQGKNSAMGGMAGLGGSAMMASAL